MTVPVAPKFTTEKRLALKDRQNKISTEDKELKEIENLRQILKIKQKQNENTIKALNPYVPPSVPKKLATVFKEFNLSTSERSSKHSEFRKLNHEKLKEQKDTEKQNLEIKKMREAQDQKRIISLYNNMPMLAKRNQNNPKEDNKFESLKSIVDKALIREESNSLEMDKSPVQNSARRHLTTPKSPELSVKKRFEFSERTKNLKTTDEIELEKANFGMFKALPCPKHI